VEQHPNWSLGCLIRQVYRRHAIRHTHPDGLHWSSNQLVVEAATRHTSNTRDEHKVPSAGLEPAISAIKRPQTYVSYRTVIVIGSNVQWTFQLHFYVRRYYATFVLGNRWRFWHTSDEFFNVKSLRLKALISESILVAYFEEGLIRNVIEYTVIFFSNYLPPCRSPDDLNTLYNTNISVRSIYCFA
jgi:hypothetical protein